MSTDLKPFFASTERQAALLEELKSWEGTRFQRNCGGLAGKGQGADCASFVETVYRNLGAIEPIQWPRYTTHGGGLPMLQLIFKTLAGISNMAPIWLSTHRRMPELMPGDLFVRSAGDDYHHFAIYGGDKTLWSMRERKGLVRANIEDRFAMKELRGIYRVYESIL